MRSAVQQLQPYPADQSQDFSCLVEEMDWKTELSSQERMLLIKEQIRLKPSFKGFSEREVLESLIIQTCKKYVLSVDSTGRGWWT